MEYSNKETGQRVKFRRKNLSLTMEELSDRTGYTSPSRKTIIYQIETGKNEIRLSRLTSFSSALQTNIYYLLGLTDIDDLTDDEILELVKEYYTKKKDPNITSE